VVEASEGTVLKKGTVYIAKGGKHLRVVKKGKDLVIALGDDAPRNTLKPCADIMYESLMDLAVDEYVCVVLTGMGSDGTRGIGQLSQRKNCYVIAQDEASSTVYGMPRMVKEAELTDEVVSLGSIAGAITNVVGTC
jgi:two-component system chemotaxis response regulator CheB